VAPEHHRRPRQAARYVPPEPLTRTAPTSTTNSAPALSFALAQSPSTPTAPTTSAATGRSGTCPSFTKPSG
jgi:hypothetical protein